MSRKQLLLIGAGDLGREVFVWFSRIDAAARDWEIKGFLDSSPQCPKIADLNATLLGSPERYVPESGDVFVCCIGAVRSRAQTCAAIERRGGRFISLVHPDAFLAPDATLGAGCVIFPSAFVDTKCVVEDHVVVYFGAKIGHHASVGHCSMLQPGSMVGSAGVLGQGVTMSTNSFSLPGVRLGEFATVGANSVAVKDVPSGITVFGVPGRPLAAPGTPAP